MKKRFIVEVDVRETPITGFHKHPPTLEQVADKLRDVIRESVGWYPLFSANNIKVSPVK